jgi:threonine/homoserine/homoserine lactone efflux protein
MAKTTTSARAAIRTSVGAALLEVFLIALFLTGVAAGLAGYK